MSKEGEVTTLDFHPVMGPRCRVTPPAGGTGGEYVEMGCTADPGMKTLVHKHPDADETSQVLSGTLEVLFQR